MKILGAILAGGQSRRFGSDKAIAVVRGKPMIAHVIDALRTQTSALVIAGRDWPGLESVNDRPESGLGPLGGLAGALHHARSHGFDAVVSSGCDVLDIPDDLVSQLGEAPAVVDDLPVVGIWTASVVEALDTWLQSLGTHSVYGFAEHIGARRISLAVPLRNINRSDDLQQSAGVSP